MQVAVKDCPIRLGLQGSLRCPHVQQMGSSPLLVKNGSVIGVGLS